MNMYIVGILILTIAVLAVIAVRQRLKCKAAAFEDEIDSSLSSFVPSCYDHIYEAAEARNAGSFEDIASIIDQQYDDCYIPGRGEKEVEEHFSELFYDADLLRDRLEAFHIEPSYKLGKFLSDYGSLHDLIERHNKSVINDRLERNRHFFDTCLAYPLDDQQRRSIVSEEDNCLVVSSAGSGKTSSIVGKVKYLTDIRKVDPERILLISYTNKAAAELTDRMGIAGLRGYTFHKLALDLIGQVTKQKPSICENTDALFVGIYRQLLKVEDFRKSVFRYFIDFQDDEADWEKRKNERRQNLAAQKVTRLKAMLPDMDGNDIYVKSVQEQKLCFVSVMRNNMSTGWLTRPIHSTSRTSLFTMRVTAS